MKSLYTIVAVLAAVALIGSIGAILQHQQASAIVIVDGKEFKKLTSDLEKAVLEAAAMDDQDQISRLLDQYVMDVEALNLSPR